MIEPRHRYFCLIVLFEAGIRGRCLTHMCEEPCFTFGHSSANIARVSKSAWCGLYIDSRQA